MANKKEMKNEEIHFTVKKRVVKKLHFNNM